MSRCADCGTLIDTDEDVECWYGDELLCETCADDARWCSQCRKRCEEIEGEDSFSLGAGSDTSHHGYLSSDCCNAGTLSAAEYKESAT